jgi:hypothetical protein
MLPKYFTLEEANLQLPFVEQELRTLQSLKGQFQEKYQELRRKKQADLQVELDSEDADPFFTLETELEFL